MLSVNFIVFTKKYVKKVQINKANKKVYVLANFSKVIFTKIKFKRKLYIAGHLYTEIQL